MTTWDEQFSPVTKSLGYGTRDQQRVMGQAIIDSLNNDENLLVEAPTGVGKSFGALIPAIHKIIKDKKRVVVSTATKSLQTQYEDDLKILRNIYPGFTYRTLYGRDNYLCFNQFKKNTLGNPEAKRYLSLIEKNTGSLGKGERIDIDRLIGYPLSDQEWRWMSGSSKSCGKNKCTSQECFSKKARDEAMAASLVITNNAILRVDADSGGEFSEKFLGDVDVLFVDEAHELESSLISGWTDEISEWDLRDYVSSIQEGVELSLAIRSHPGVEYSASKVSDLANEFLQTVVEFFSLLKPEENWKFLSEALSLRYVSTSDPKLVFAMNRYEEDGPQLLTQSLAYLEEIETHLASSMKDMIDSGNTKGIRKISKGLTASKHLTALFKRMIASLSTKDGVVLDYGVPYTILLEGIEKRDGTKACKIVSVPMDVSAKAEKIWEGRTSILMSATLKDLARGNFEYVKDSLGFKEAKECVVGTVFDHLNKQVVYVTAGTWPKEDLPGAWFAVEEIVSLIRASKGRALVLFTSRKELEYAADELDRLIGTEYPLIVQTKEANKSKIAEEFKAIENSVLLATKSFFQGFNAPGSGLSHVIIAKFPLPQYNTVCRNQIAWWAKRGYRDWYESRSLEVFQQAQGRLLRTEDDFGVVSLIDQRVLDPKQKVCNTAMKAVSLSGSGVIRTIQEVSNFL